jgi:hypothetical protein
LALLAAAGCGGQESSARVVLGTGEARFEPIEGEPVLSLVAGPQGGSHVWASLLAYGFDPGPLSMVLTTSLPDVPDSRLVMGNPLTTREVIDELGEPAQTFAGYPARVYQPRCAHGKRVRLEITLSDASGRQASDVRHCIADVPEAGRSASCPL